MLVTKIAGVTLGVNNSGISYNDAAIGSRRSAPIIALSINSIDTSEGNVKSETEGDLDVAMVDKTAVKIIRRYRCNRRNQRQQFPARRKAA